MRFRDGAGLMSSLLAAAALSACQAQNSAPSAPAPVAASGVPVQDSCFEVMPGAAPQKLRAVQYQVPNLETCAVQIEGLRLEKGHDVTGQWNGVWIYANAQEVASSNGPGAARYAIFQPDQKAQIDQSLTQQLQQAKAAKSGASSRGGSQP